MQRWFVAVLVVVCLVAVGDVSAQPPSSQPSSIVLDQAEPRLGDWVTFTVTFPHQLKSKNVRIQILCYQEGVLVYGAAESYVLPQQLGGGSSDWFETGGAATCIATLYYWTYNRVQTFNFLAETQFEAGDRLF